MGSGISTASRRDELTIVASGAEVERASGWLAAACLNRDIPTVQAQRLEICLNEVLANVLAYGGDAALAAPIRLQLEILRSPEGSEARVTVSDAGIAFNPLTVKIPPRPSSLTEAQVGGLGLVMIRRCSDWLDYRHEDGHNHFTVGTRWERS